MQGGSGGSIKPPFRVKTEYQNNSGSKQQCWESKGKAPVSSHSGQSAEVSEAESDPIISCTENVVDNSEVSENNNESAVVLKKLVV